MAKKGMIINDLVKMNINNSEQWVLVRGTNSEKPLIIHVQAGPGLPMIPEANCMEKTLRLEDDFLVAYWDQRGCGKSCNKSIDPKTINFAQMADDIISCVKHLLNRYKKDSTLLIGYSIGATASLMAASQESSLFGHLFLVSIDIDIPTANKCIIEFATTKAKEKGNRRLYDLANNF
jgi:predicted alpha/beta-fold hydrolase